MRLQPVRVISIAASALLPAVSIAACSSSGGSSSPPPSVYFSAGPSASLGLESSGKAPAAGASAAG